MLGLDNPIHLAFILVLLLLVFGAKRLPEMGRSLGAGLRGFKESITADDHVSSFVEHSPERSGHLDAATIHGDRPGARAEHTPVQPVA
jgi:sec-independent protein translocase protein TatA